jgi:membrane-bound serine protease (ClpP class)
VLAALLLALALCGLRSWAGAATVAAGPEAGVGKPDPVQVLYVQLDGAISPAQVDLLSDSLAEAQAGGARLMVIRLDTPGGLGESMREMVKLLLNAPLPVAVWVGPGGAHAASAGVYLVAAAQIAAMHPQATMGAGSPVGLGGEDIGATMAEKVKGDLIGLIRSAAGARGRNVEWYVSAVEHAAVITGPEAVAGHVVEYLAADVPDLLDQIGKKGLESGAAGVGPVHFSRAEVRLVEHEPGFRHTLLAWLLHPQVAYFLLLGGLMGLFFELSTPGAILPGVLGGLCFLLALYALAILPTNIAGLLLILFSALLFGLELFVVSHGLLAVAGLVSLFFGSTILFRTGMGMEGLPMSTIIATVGATAALVAAGAYLVARSQLGKPQSGTSTLVGECGTVLAWPGDRGQIKIRGEIWFARTKDGSVPESGARVVVTAVDGLVLTVDQFRCEPAISTNEPGQPTGGTP